MQDEISVLVIEDEEIWANKIKYDLNQFGFKVTSCEDTFEKALTAIHQNNFDIVLLDINLNGKNTGIELGKIITFIAQKPFVFITGSMQDDIIRDAAVARPSAFLTKPVTPASLFITIQSAIHHFNSDTSATIPAKSHVNDNTFFFVKNNNKYKKIEWQNVVCLRSEKNYISVITVRGETHLIRSSLQKALRDIIPEQLKSIFFQINRAEVLQLNNIDELIGDEARVGTQSYHINDAYLKNLKQQLNIIL